MLHFKQSKVIKIDLRRFKFPNPHFLVYVVPFYLKEPCYIVRLTLLPSILVALYTQQMIFIRHFLIYSCIISRQLMLDEVSLAPTPVSRIDGFSLTMPKDRVVTSLATLSVIQGYSLIFLTIIQHLLFMWYQLTFHACRCNVKADGPTY